MTQRRRLDAYLAEQAVAAGAEFRDGVPRRRSSSTTRVDGRVAGDASRPTCSSAPTARTASSRRPLGLGAGIVRGVALEGNVALALLDRSATAAAP